MAKNILLLLTTATCGLLAATPVGAGTIDLNASVNGPTITTQNAGSAGSSFGMSVGGSSLTGLSGGELVDLAGPLARTGLRTLNSTVTFHRSSTETDMTSGPSVTGKTRERQADPSVEAATVPEPLTWVMVGLGFAGVAMLGLTKPRRKQPRYTV